MKTDPRIIDQHLATMRKRWEDQGLTLLELCELSLERVDEFKQAETGPRRERIEAESQLLNQMIAEMSPPDPTPEETAQSLEDAGNTDAAEHLRHQIKIDAAAELVTEKERIIEEGRESHSTAWLKRQEGELEQLQGKHLDLANTRSPVHQLQIDQQTERKERDRALAAGNALLENPDPVLREQGQQMIAEASGNE